MFCKKNSVILLAAIACLLLVSQVTLALDYYYDSTGYIEDCPFCYQGEEPNIPCGKVRRKVLEETRPECVDCKDGWYQPNHDSTAQCRACKVPTDPNREMIVKCSRKHGGTSKCKDWYFEDHNSDCRHCCAQNYAKTFKRIRKCGKYLKQCLSMTTYKPTTLKRTVFKKITPATTMKTTTTKTTTNEPTTEKTTEKTKTTEPQTVKVTEKTTSPKSTSTTLATTNQSITVLHGKIETTSTSTKTSLPAWPFIILIVLLLGCFLAAGILFRFRRQLSQLIWSDEPHRSGSERSQETEEGSLLEDTPKRCESPSLLEPVAGPSDVKTVAKIEETTDHVESKCLFESMISSIETSYSNQLKACHEGVAAYIWSNEGSGLSSPIDGMNDQFWQFFNDFKVHIGVRVFIRQAILSLLRQLVPPPKQLYRLLQRKRFDRTLRRINVPQWNVLLPPGSDVSLIETWDLTLIFAVFPALCPDLPEPENGWFTNELETEDKGKSACVKNARILRNLISHKVLGEYTKKPEEFIKMMHLIKDVLEGLLDPTSTVFHEFYKLWELDKAQLFRPPDEKAIYHRVEEKFITDLIKSMVSYLESKQNNRVLQRN